MKISEITFIQWLGIVLIFNGAILGYSNEVQDLFGPVWQKHIFSVLTIGSAIVGGLVTMFGGLGTQARNVVAAGGQVNVPPQAASALTTLAADRSEPAIKAVVKILLLAFALSLLFLPASGAMAQQMARRAAQPAQQGPVFTGDLGTDIKNGFKGDPKAPGAVQLTGNGEKDMQAVVKRIQDLGRADLNYAILKATAANTNGSKVRLQCLQAILAAKDAAEGTGIKDAQGNVIPRPDPAAVTTIEDVAELVDSLSPQGPLMTGCAGAAQLFKTNTLAAINGIVTGAVGLAAGGFPIAIP